MGGGDVPPKALTPFLPRDGTVREKATYSVNFFLTKQPVFWDQRKSFFCLFENIRMGREDIPHVGNFLPTILSIQRAVPTFWTKSGKDFIKYNIDILPIRVPVIALACWPG